jgi:hypothetical protein
MQALAQTEVFITALAEATPMLLQTVTTLQPGTRACLDCPEERVPVCLFPGPRMIMMICFLSWEKHVLT